MNKEILFIIIEFILLFIILFPLFFTLIQIKVNMGRCERSFNDVSKLGFSIGIIAPIRKGKTRFMSGLVNAIESTYQGKIMEEMNQCKTILHYLDFNFIDRYLYEEYSKVDRITYYVRKKVFYDLIELLNFPNGIYNDFINNKSLYQLFFKYVDDFYIINFRKCFVVAKNSLYSFITRSFCAYLLDETLDIKDVIMNKCFYLERYLCICYDEKSIDRGNLKSLKKSIERDTGRKELTALCGQVFEETTYLISVKQSAVDEEVSERRLCVSNLELRESKITNNMYFILSYFKYKIAWLNFRYNLYFKLNFRLKKKYGDFYTWVNSGDSKYRLRQLQYKHCIDYVRSLGVVNNLLYNYSRADDVGKKEENLYEKMVFSFPLNVCIGVYDTHEYKFLLESLQSMSKYCFGDVPRINFFKTNEIKANMSRFLYERKDVKK